MNELVSLTEEEYTWDDDESTWSILSLKLKVGVVIWAILTLLLVGMLLSFLMIPPQIVTTYDGSEGEDILEIELFSLILELNHGELPSPITGANIDYQRDGEVEGYVRFDTSFNASTVGIIVLFAISEQGPLLPTFFDYILEYNDTTLHFWSWFNVFVLYEVSLPIDVLLAVSYVS